MEYLVIVKSKQKVAFLLRAEELNRKIESIIWNMM